MEAVKLIPAGIVYTKLLCLESFVVLAPKPIIQAMTALCSLIGSIAILDINAPVCTVLECEALSKTIRRFPLTCKQPCN